MLSAIDKSLDDKALNLYLYLSPEEIENLAENTIESTLHKTDRQRTEAGRLTLSLDWGLVNSKVIEVARDDGYDVGVFLSYGAYSGLCCSLREEIPELVVRSERGACLHLYNYPLMKKAGSF